MVAFEEGLNILLHLDLVEASVGESRKCEYNGIWPDVNFCNVFIQ